MYFSPKWRLVINLILSNLILSYCYFSIMFFVISCFIPSLKVVFIQAKHHTQRQNIWAIAPILLEKLNMLNLPCKTVQDYPARLHASYCATLQGVARNMLQGFLHAILHRVGRPLACVHENNPLIAS